MCMVQIKIMAAGTFDTVIQNLERKTGAFNGIAGPIEFGVGAYNDAKFMRYATTEFALECGFQGPFVDTCSMHRSYSQEHG